MRRNRTFCALFTQKKRFAVLFHTFLALFLESAETPLSVQINVLAVWALRLDRKYTNSGWFMQFFYPPPHKAAVSRQLSLPKTCVFFDSTELLSPKVLDLDGCFSSAKIRTFSRFFARLTTFHARSLKQISGNFNGFPSDSRRLSIHFNGFSGIFSHFQSSAVSCNQFQSIALTL